MSITTATEIAGLFTGANPAKLATSLGCEYVCVATSIFCAVPVFPAELYPFSFADLPVPSVTMPCIIDRIFAEVSSETTRCAPSGSGDGRLVPGRNAAGFSRGSPFVMSMLLSSTCGGRYTPPFAIALTIVTSCTGVTATSCPIAIDRMLLAPHFFGARSNPRVSLGSSIPVRSPKPKPFM